MLIGLCGVATAGKDLLADQLVASKYKFVKLGFADPMYAMAEAMNPLIKTESGLIVPLSSLLKACYGDWTEVKRVPAVRKFLQDLGQSGREFIGADVWVKPLFDRIDALPPDTNIIITNVRHENEAEAVLARGGRILRIERPGVGPVNGHVSDAGLTFKYATEVLFNDGTAEDWKRNAVTNFERLFVSR